MQCPGPILKIKQNIDAIKPGERVEIHASDPGFERDVQAWCRTTGHELIEQTNEKGIYRAVVEKKADNKQLLLKWFQVIKEKHSSCSVTTWTKPWPPLCWPTVPRYRRESQYLLYFLGLNVIKSKNHKFQRISLGKCSNDVTFA